MPQQHLGYSGALQWNRRLWIGEEMRIPIILV